MPRTALARLLREMHKIVGASPEVDMSVEKLLRLRQEAACSRKVIAGAGDKAGHPGEQGFRQAWARDAAAPRIVIVGAGLAGLTCAYRLTKAGLRPVVYEADAAPVAGRCITKKGLFGDRQFIEQGGMLIDTGHRELRRLIHELGLQVNDLLAAERTGTEPCYFFDGQPYTFAEAAEDFRSIVHKLNRDLKLAGFPTLYSSYTQRAFELDHMSVTDWINVTVPGGVGSRLGKLIDTACNIEYGAESGTQSALNFIYLHGFISGDEPFQLFGQSDERFQIRGGNGQLLQRLGDRLDEKQVVRGARLIALREKEDGAYRLTFQRDADFFDVEADKVALTVPFSILRSSVDWSQAGFKPLKQEAIRQLGMGWNSKLHLQFTDRHWMKLNCNGDTVADTGYQNTFDVSRVQPGQSGLLVDYTGGHTAGGMISGTPEERARQFLRQIEPVMPGITAKWNGKAARDYWPGNPYTLGSYSYRKIGQYTRLAGVEREAEGRRGNCHFAGEHTSVAYQGYMNGAVESGERAAKEIIADLRRLEGR